MPAYRRSWQERDTVKTCRVGWESIAYGHYWIGRRDVVTQIDPISTTQIGSGLEPIPETWSASPSKIEITLGLN